MLSGVFMAADFEFLGSSKEEAQAVIGGNLNLAGGLCIACSVLLIVSLHASTVLSGYVMMTRRIMFWCNLLTFVLSAVGESHTNLLVSVQSQSCFAGLGVSSYAIEKNPSAIPQGSAFPAVCILFFVIIVMCAFYGCVASYSKRVCVLGVQTFICICGLICIFAIAIAALQHNSAAQIWINEHWQQISDNFIRVDKEVALALGLCFVAVTICPVRGIARVAKPFYYWYYCLSGLRHSRFQYLGVHSVSCMNISLNSTFEQI
jgi:hypothetical protein